MIMCSVINTDKLYMFWVQTLRRFQIKPRFERVQTFNSKYKVQQN